MIYQNILLLATIGGATAWLIIRLILKRTRWTDTAVRGQEFHQAHATPISRFGGVALAAAFVVVALVALVASTSLPSDLEISPQNIAVVLGGLAMFLVGLLDDLRPVNAKLKFLAQIAIATTVTLGGELQFERWTNPYTSTTYELGAFGSFLTVFWLVAVTNLINLTDGLDGLAGGISFMVLCLMSVFAVETDASVPGMLAVGMAGAVLGFLNFNFPPARIYMGDGGAYLLGFLIASLSLANSQKGMVAAALFAPACALIVPIYDVLVTILRRGARGLPIFRPDRKHLHHRLAQLGLSPKRAVTILYALSLLFVLLGLSVFWTGGKMLPPVIGFALLVGLIGLRSMARLERWIEVRHLFGTMLEVRRETRHALALSRWLELSAERTENSEELWRDFQFLLGKLKFTAVTLRIEGVERRWVNAASPPQSGDLTDEHHFSNSGKPVTLEIHGSPSTLTPKVFFLLAELAAEAWLKAAHQWQQKHRGPVQFSRNPEATEFR